MADRTGISRGGEKIINLGSGGPYRTHRKTVRYDHYDYNLMAAVILLTCLGLVMLCSIGTYSTGNLWSFFKQAVIAAGSFVLLLFVSRIDYHSYIRLSGWLYVGSCVLLIVTRFVGRTANGATRWLTLGPISIQPAEIAKLAVILFLPYVITSMSPEKLSDWKAVALILSFGALTFVLTYYFTDNLSTAIIIFAIAIVLTFIVHPKTRPFLIAAAILAVIVAIVVFGILPGILSNADNVGSFRIRRILVWLDPEAYSDEGGYQVLQGLYAIGSGGLLGKGLGNGIQKLGKVPEAENDMIFSIICEELGIFGAVLTIGLFVFLLYRLFYIAMRAPDLLGSLIACGIFVHIALQVVLNIAVVINLIPTTGITLPFISAGGTSVLFLMMEIAVALNISSQIED